MHAPARTHRQIAHQALIDNQGLKQNQGRNTHQQHRPHQPKAAAFPLQETVTIGRRQPIHNPAEKSEQRDFAHRDQGCRNRHGNQPGCSVPDIVPHKRPEALRRNTGAGLRERIDSAFKEAQHNPHPWPRARKRTSCPRLRYESGAPLTKGCWALSQQYTSRKNLVPVGAGPAARPLAGLQPLPRCPASEAPRVQRVKMERHCFRKAAHRHHRPGSFIRDSPHNRCAEG